MDKNLRMARSKGAHARRRWWTDFGTSSRYLQREITAAIGGKADLSVDIAKVTLMTETDFIISGAAAGAGGKGVVRMTAGVKIGRPLP